MAVYSFTLTLIASESRRVHAMATRLFGDSLSRIEARVLEEEGEVFNFSMEKPDESERGPGIDAWP